jgi:hypothetical protein
MAKPNHGLGSKTMVVQTIESRNVTASKEPIDEIAELKF